MGFQPVRPSLLVLYQGTPFHLVWALSSGPGDLTAGPALDAGVPSPCLGDLSGLGLLPRWSSGLPPSGRLVVGDGHCLSPGLFPREAITLPPLSTEPRPAGLSGGGAADSLRPGCGLLLGSEVPPASGHSPRPQ